MGPAPTTTTSTSTSFQLGGSGVRRPASPGSGGRQRASEESEPARKASRWIEHECRHPPEATCAASLAGLVLSRWPSKCDAISGTLTLRTGVLHSSPGTQMWCAARKRAWAGVRSPRTRQAKGVASATMAALLAAAPRVAGPFPAAAWRVRPLLWRDAGRRDCVSHALDDTVHLNGWLPPAPARGRVTLPHRQLRAGQAAWTWRRKLAGALSRPTYSRQTALASLHRPASAGVTRLSRCVRSCTYNVQFRAGWRGLAVFPSVPVR